MAVIKTPPSTHARANGYSAVKHSKNPEGWLRGSAALDKTTAVLTMRIQLETDSVASGPKGFITIDLQNDSKETIGTVKTGNVWCGGKPPGKARRRNFRFEKKLPARLASATQHLEAKMTQTGKKVQLWSVSLKDAIEAAAAAITIIASL